MLIMSMNFSLLLFQVDNDLDPTYMEPITNFLPTQSNTISDSGAPLTTSSSSLKPTLHYAQVQLSANPPTPAPPAEHRPVNYAIVQKSATPKKVSHNMYSFHSILLMNYSMIKTSTLGIHRLLFNLLNSIPDRPSL